MNLNHPALSLFFSVEMSLCIHLYDMFYSKLVQFFLLGMSTPLKKYFLSSERRNTASKNGRKAHHYVAPFLKKMGCRFQICVQPFVHIVMNNGGRGLPFSDVWFYL